MHTPRLKSKRLKVQKEKATNTLKLDDSNKLYNVTQKLLKHVLLTILKNCQPTTRTELQLMNKWYLSIELTVLILLHAMRNTILSL